MDLLEVIKNIGVHPIFAYLLGVVTTIIIIYFRHYLGIRSKEKRLKCDFGRLMGGGIHDYNHWVKHILLGDTGYVIKLEEDYKYIRSLARKHFDLVKSSHPDFLIKVYAYTDYGRKVTNSDFIHDTFNRHEVALAKMVTSIQDNNCNS